MVWTLETSKPMKGLRANRVPGVHRMTDFVRESVNIAEHVLLVIHQQVGRIPIAPGTECAAGLSFVFVPVAPSLFPQPVAQDPLVFLAERRQRRENGIGRLIKRN